MEAVMDGLGSRASAISLGIKDQIQFTDAYNISPSFAMIDGV
jgi:hypothetical protein